MKVSVTSISIHDENVDPLSTDALRVSLLDGYPASIKLIKSGSTISLTLDEASSLNQALKQISNSSSESAPVSDNYVTARPVD